MFLNTDTKISILVSLGTRIQIHWIGLKISTYLQWVFLASPSQGKERVEFWDEILHEYLLQVIQVSTQITMQWRIQQSTEINKVHHYVIKAFSIYTVFSCSMSNAHPSTKAERATYNFKTINLKYFTFTEILKDRPTEEIAVRMRQQKSENEILRKWKWSNELGLRWD